MRIKASNAVAAMGLATLLTSQVLALGTVIKESSRDIYSPVSSELIQIENNYALIQGLAQGGGLAFIFAYSPQRKPNYSSLNL